MRRKQSRVHLPSLPPIINRGSWSRNEQVPVHTGTYAPCSLGGFLFTWLAPPLVVCLLSTLSTKRSSPSLSYTIPTSKCPSNTNTLVQLSISLVYNTATHIPDSTGGGGGKNKTQNLPWNWFMPDSSANVPQNTMPETKKLRVREENTGLQLTETGKSGTRDKSWAHWKCNSCFCYSKFLLVPPISWQFPIVALY